MARTVPGPVPGSLRAFVPEAFSNRSDPTPIRVWILNPNEAEKRKYDAASRLQVRFNGTGGPQTAFDMSAEMERWKDIIGRFVTKVENYSAPNGEAIDTGEKLAVMGETEILREVVAEIQTAASLTESEKKTSVGSSVST